MNFVYIQISSPLVKNKFFISKKTFKLEVPSFHARLI